MGTLIGILFAIFAIGLTLLGRGYKKKAGVVFWIGVFGFLVGLIGWALLGWEF